VWSTGLGVVAPKEKAASRSSAAAVHRRYAEQLCRRSDDRLGRSSRHAHVFDNADRLTNRRYPDASRATFAYGANGNRTTTETAAARITATYDGVTRRDSATTKYNV
jgi:YD repeat-containing protein